MPILPQKNVLRLDVSINYIVLMQIGKTHENFNNIEPWHIFTQSLVLLDQTKELSSWTIFNHKDEKFPSLECKFHVNEEGMAGILHDISFIHDDVLLFVLDDHIFIDHFHGIEVSILFESTQVYFRKTTWTNQFYDFKAIQSEALPFINTSFPVGRFEVERLPI